MFFGYFSDPDLGYLGDDYVGYDTLLNLAYCYNAENDDAGYYGVAPPAVGYKLLQGPIKRTSTSDSAFFNYRWIKEYINKKISAFNFWSASTYWQCEPSGFVLNAEGLYSLFNGKTFEPWCHSYLTDIIDPTNGEQTNIMCPGDPVIGTGWYEGDGWPNALVPGDRRMLMGSESISMAPGDTQEVVIAIIAAQGSDNLQSITELKKTARTVQYFYDNYIPELVNINYEPPLPEFYYLSQNHPNPFNPTTVIDFELPINGFVSLKVFDILGREIATLVNEAKSAGIYQVEFSASNLSSGVYYYRIQAGSFAQTRKMILLK